MKVSTFTTSLALVTSAMAAATALAKMCGGFAGLPCPEGQACILSDIDGADAMGRCVPDVSVRELAQRKASSPIYYAFLPEVDIAAVVDARLAQDDAPESLKDLRDSLRKQHRITNRPHITIVHKANLPQEQALWDRCAAQVRESAPPSYQFRLGSIVSDGRLIAVSIDDVKPADGMGADTMKEAQAFMNQMGDALKQRMHTTVGTKPGVAAVESGPVVASWRSGQAGNDVIALKLEDTVVTGTMKGMF